jgi:hypothetical protein
LARTLTYRSRSHNKSSRTSPNSQKKSIRTRTETTTRIITRKTTPNSQIKSIRTRTETTTRTISRNYDIYVPKGAHLTIDDFRCIFCFKLPKYSVDKGRGIVLCPVCRYPAHADEFKEWSRNSKLCSRCNAPISASYRSKPKIMSVKNYIIISKHFLRK